MNKPDWSKAPEWATHAVTTGRVWEYGPRERGAIKWARLVGNKYYCSSEPHDKDHFIIDPRAWVVLEARPTQWRGPEDGLPPVGTVCEIAPSTEFLKIDYPEGAQVKVYAHFTDDRGVYLAAFIEDAPSPFGGVAIARCFRPIKTQEQRELEQLQADIDEAFQANAKLPHGALSEFLHAKGWRKP